MKSDFFIVEGTVCLGNELLEDGFVAIRDGKIEKAGRKGGHALPDAETITFPHPVYIVPGFIDVHIHGAGGADTMDATPEALDTIAKTLAKEGTTAFLATTITQSPQAIEKALANAASYIKEQNAPGKAEVVGIHLEGPFINAKRKGAQPEEYILEPDVETFQKWQNLAEGHIRLVTMAPECPNGLELVHYLSKNRCIASIGHSDADYADVKAAVEAGATHVTHLFNGMKGIHHREPGTAGAALLFDELTVELIADGIHVRPEMFRLILQAKGLDRVVLITDAMRAKCLKNGVYDLGGQDVHVRDGKALLSDGTLAGSILKMKDGIKNILAHTSLTLPEAVKLASENPARELGLFDRKGSLEAGKDADLVVLNEQYEPILTICRGAIAFKGEF